MPDFIRRMPLWDRERYLRTAKDGTMKRRHIRIMIVGKQSAGKTCLMRRLLNEEIDDVISTDGINVEVRRCKVQISDGQWIFSEGLCFGFAEITIVFQRHNIYIVFKGYCTCYVIFYRTKIMYLLFV